MNHFQILSRAWKILWSYRALWGFGILIALASARGGNNGSGIQFSGGGGNGSGFNPPADFERGFNRLGEWLESIFAFNSEAINTAIAIGIAVLCLVVLLAVLFRILYYVSHTALIRLVDRYEASGEKLGFRQGFRVGWSRQAWRLFLIDLVVFLPLMLILLGLIGCGLMFYFFVAGPQGDPNAAGVVGLIGFAFLLVFLGVIVGVALSLVVNLIRRYAVLRELGVIEAIRAGFGLLRRRFVDVLLMWLILLGLYIGYTIVLIPLVLLLVGAGLLVAAPLAALAYFLGQAGSDVAGIVAALVVGLPVFIAILAIPLAFVEGLRETFDSTVWTLVFRELTLGGEAEAIEPAAPLPDETAVVPEAGEPPESGEAEVFPA